MLDILWALLASIILYLLPGFAILQCVVVQGMPRARQLFFALVLSLIVVPYLLITIGQVLHFIPNPLHIGIISVLFLILAFILKKINRRPLISLQTPQGETNPGKRFEPILVWVGIIVFSILVNLPRLAMFVFGGKTQFVAPFDETWHLAELVSVARTGIAPAHYYYPNLSLTYYYASWVMPAILGNIPGYVISLNRAMSIHTVVQTAAFLGSIYYFLLYNLKRGWVRALGMAFFSVIGGFDLYMQFPSTYVMDWWQKAITWLTPYFQISQFVTLYAYVPHHMAGAMVFVLLFFIWKNLNASLVLKSIFTGVALGFCFATSPFLFITSALCIFIFLLFKAKAFIKEPKKLLHLAIIAAGFLLLAVPMVLLFSGRDSSFAYSGISTHIMPMFQNSLKLTHWLSPYIDQALPIITFPLIAMWLLVVEMGIAFILYILWLVKRIGKNAMALNSPFEWLMVILPPVYLLLGLLIQDFNSGGNFLMRGFIPAQILIIFGALYYLDQLVDYASMSIWQKILGGWVIICFLFAQFVSAYFEIDSTANEVVSGVKSILVDKTPVQKFSSGLSPDRLFYITWLNTHTPANALILENGCMTNPHQMKESYRWLERARFVSPQCAEVIWLYEYDDDFYLPADFAAYAAAAEGAADILDLYHQTDFTMKGNMPLYVVNWDGDVVWSGGGEQVYQDDYVTIYALEAAQ